MSKAKPIIKWVGGKTKLITHLNENLPKEFNNYFEPFVGGASVILEMLSKDVQEGTREYTISDINDNLINTYQVVQKNLDELITELAKEKYANNLESYTSNRVRYNSIKSENNDNVERAALFIYLNKCGYNGMYRENSKGGYNIPFGKMNNPKICDVDTLRKFSTSVQKVTIECAGYNEIMESTEKHDFVYLDPPYDGDNNKMFTDYTNNSFGRTQQKELKEFVDALTEKGVHVMISNSATEFIKELYSEYNIKYLTTKYSIGGKDVKRDNKKEEVLITNY